MSEKCTCGHTRAAHKSVGTAECSVGICNCRAFTVTPQTLGGYQGLRIAAIQPGSYIEELGLQKDDLLLGVNGKPLRSFGDVSGLGDLIDKSAITLEVLRNGKKTIIRYDVQS